MPETISEEELETFEGWLRYQGQDADRVGAEELKMWRGYFEEDRATSVAIPKVGRMKFKSTPGEHRYGVAIRKDSDLWLTLWVRHSPKGEFFVMAPRGNREWNSHVSYHLNGTCHSKSYGRAGLTKQLQPLTGKFSGAESLWAHGGHFTDVGAVCDPADFNGVVEVEKGVLGPRDGMVLVDLVEPGYKPFSHPGQIEQERVFKDFVPHLVIRIASS